MRETDEFNQRCQRTLSCTTAEQRDVSRNVALHTTTFTCCACGSLHNITALLLHSSAQQTQGEYLH